MPPTWTIYCDGLSQESLSRGDTGGDIPGTTLEKHTVISE